MTDAQKRFCEEYLISLNATKAYKTAYPSCKKDETANVNSSRLLRNAKVQSYIQERQKELQKTTKITQQQIIEELAAIAFFNIKNIYNEDGSLKSVKDIDDKTARAISSVKTLQRAGSMKLSIGLEGQDEEAPIEHLAEQTIEYKTNDKKGALELLGKHLGMFKEKVELEQDKPFEVNITVKKSNT